MQDYGSIISDEAAVKAESNKDHKGKSFLIRDMS